jgi:hypothetical protein
MQNPAPFYLIGSAHAEIIVGDHQSSLMQVLRERPGKIEPEDLFGKPSPTQPCDRAGPKQSTSLAPVAHAEFVAALAGHPPRSIPVDTDAIDLEDRADHLGKLFRALSVYLTLILDDTAQNVPGRLDLPNVEGILSDLAADLTGALQHAAEDMAWGAP